MLVATGDIILAMDRPVVSAGLKLARVSATDLPALLVQRVARIRPHDVEARYLYHLLESQAFIDHMRASEVGTQVPHVTLKGIREFSVPLPTRDEQRRIVDILEDHLSRLDAAVDGLATAQRRSHSLGAVTLESLAPTDTPVRTLGRSYDGLEG